LATGESVGISVDPAHLHLFDAETGQRVEIDSAGERQLEAAPEGTSGLAS
jgi:hypothetical protein